MLSLDVIKTDLTNKVKFQQVPIPMTSSDYLGFVVQGLKRLYVDEGIESSYSLDFNATTNIISRNLTLTEIEYITVSSEIAFRNQIKDDLSSIVSFSTNALSVSNGDKPFKNLNDIITVLESRLSKLAFKFTHKSSL
ncbi:hypothetical protein [Clostridium sp.]|uniref:hypothetical protein n=1 Tax=Clostridium sp. TaxID=1506 RepID=UPI001A58F7F4|nr:hypothetical protein [Clostridium sp.]MBK5239813.1 hypothetical protein [Clostridium sp.]